MNARLALLVAAAMAATLASTVSTAAPYKVGNGDDGTDIEGLSPITSGKILRARERAIRVCEKVNTPGIRGLGQLLPELRNSKLFLARKDVAAALAQDKGTHHSNLKGQVYARTFTEPNAPTRFFPAALKLDPDELVALHIHEALHRALPPDVRDDEEAVSRITLAISAPEPTHDLVVQVVNEELPKPIEPTIATNPPTLKAAPNQFVHFMRSDPGASRFQVGYHGRQYVRGTGSLERVQATRGHDLGARFLVANREQFEFGVGAAATALERGQSVDLAMLTLGTDFKYYFFESSKGVRSYVRPTLTFFSPISEREGIESMVGERPVETFGVAVGSEYRFLYGEVAGLYTGSDTGRRKIGNVDYDSTYGRVVTTQGRLGATLRRPTMAWRLGAIATAHFSDAFEVSSKNFAYSTGSYRVVTLGPEMAWTYGSLELGVRGAFLVSSSSNSELDFLGNPVAFGTGKGDVGLVATYRF